MLFSQACEQDLLFPYYNWFWVSKEIGNLKPSGCDNGTIAYLHHEILDEKFQVLQVKMKNSRYNAVSSPTKLDIFNNIVA